MGTLSRINHHLFSKPKFLSSSSFFRNFSQAAVPPPGTIDPQQQAHHHAPPPLVVGDTNPNHSKTMFLIDHPHKGITKHERLSAASAADAEICSPFSGRPGRHRLVGTCKELAVFWREDWDEEPNQNGEDYQNATAFHQYQRRLTLWNPTTNQIKTLPLYSRLISYTRPVFRIGFPCVALGFDSTSHDYKLLCFPEYICTDKSNSWGQDNVELYSLKTDSWKWIKHPSFPCDNPALHHYPSLCIYINGVFYWATKCIFSFDFAVEKFSRMSLPPHILRVHDDYCLAEFHGSLAIIVAHSDVPAEELTEEEKKKQLQQPFRIKIWVRNGKQWKQAPRVAVGDFPVGDKIARVLGLFQNDYLFLQGFNDA